MLLDVVLHEHLEAAGEAPVRHGVVFQAEHRHRGRRHQRLGRPVRMRRLRPVRQVLGLGEALFDRRCVDLRGRAEEMIRRRPHELLARQAIDLPAVGRAVRVDEVALLG
ncbi:MAG: hypothetical protein ACK559_30440, partial [bacterium]